MANPIPEGANTVNVYLAVDDGRAAIDFYERAFGAQAWGVMDGPDGKVGHAALGIGDSLVMLSDPFPQSSLTPPKELGGTGVAIFLYVEDVDSVHQRALDAGATELMAPEDMFWGDRWARVSDPFGHEWQIATHIEDVSSEDMAARAKEAMGIS